MRALFAVIVFSVALAGCASLRAIVTPSSDEIPNVQRLAELCTIRLEAVENVTLAMASDLQAPEGAAPLVSPSSRESIFEAVEASSDCEDPEVLARIVESDDPDDEARKVLIENATATVGLVSSELIRSTIPEWEAAGRALVSSLGNLAIRYREL